MKTKIVSVTLLALALMLLAVPVYALGLGISPAEVTLDVPANGSAQVDFKVYKFTGDVSVELEDIPLRMEPATIQVIEEGQKITLTLYGDEGLNDQTYHGYIKFLGRGSGNVAVQIKVIATINHIAKIVQTPEEPPLKPAPPKLPEQAPQAGFPIIPVVGAIIGGAILISLTVLVVRRRQ